MCHGVCRLTCNSPELGSAVDAARLQGSTFGAGRPGVDLVRCGTHLAGGPRFSRREYPDRGYSLDIALPRPGWVRSGHGPRTRSAGLVTPAGPRLRTWV